MNVVVGGGSGIGAAVVPLLPGETIVADRVGGDVACDLTDRASLDRLAASVDRLDALVVTAGVSPAMADPHTILDVNLAGTARVLEAFDGLVAPGVVAVVVASMAAHLVTWPDETVRQVDEPHRAADAGLADDPGLAYALSKLGVIRLVRRLAPSWGSRGARIVSVSPGVVETPMGRLESDQTAGTTEIMRMSALERPGQPEELGAVIAFLCSQGASYMTGTDVLVDGGSVAAVRQLGGGDA